ncbi:hypothetical protein ODJ79_11225 [Actinoplanes sp. KI2]|uniref:hypothetical protein n=1 Tax=Actinoplanes sp. KI2 TaxID=2983315 RepID=UPI0021D610D2|nr:hypothetical protein [Actinoplanes sp. KI2]MCU7724287.1 hypothetical protein [Actinoplanes sp. KI2]
MGYSGFVIIARTGDTRLDDLACVDDLFVAVTDTVYAAGWRIGSLGPVDDTTPGRLARTLAQETGASAIALDVFDSDCAFAVAADPGGGTVRFHLNEQLIRAMSDDTFEPLNTHATPGLLAWAGTAGLTAGPDRLAAALDERPGPFGEGIHHLARALGITELTE